MSTSFSRASQWSTPDAVVQVRLVFGASGGISSQPRHDRSASSVSVADEDAEGQSEDVAAEVLQALEAIVQEQSSQISNTCRYDFCPAALVMQSLGLLSSETPGCPQTLRVFT